MIDTINMTAVELGLCKDAMSGDKGEVLLDVIQDNFLLKDAATPDEAMQKAGIAKVFKFIRALHKDSDNFIINPQPKTNNE